MLMHSKCLVPHVNAEGGSFRSFRPNGFMERHYVRSARPVCLAHYTVSVGVPTQGPAPGLTSRTTINLRNFGNRRFGYGITC